jgi:palmitoyltransferase ZDHHC9/14/18
MSTSQLPLPSSSSSRSFLPPTQTLNKPQTLNIPKSPTSSAKSSSSLHGAPPFSAPSLTTTFPSLQRSSSTHAGGIQPSASFFHPSKPSQQPYYSRPSSVASVVSADDPGHIQLEPLSKQISNGSDDPSTTDDHHPRRRQQSRRYKHSREPLLPFAPRTTDITSQPSFTPRVGSPTQSSTGPGTRVQTSFDRILRRGMSLDSSSTGLPLEERKLSDLEQAFGVTPSRRAALRHHIPPSADPSSFNPIPPPDDPPLSAVPVKDPVTGKWLRNYQVHPSRNKFFFGGRMLTGGDSPWAFIASSFLVLAIAGVWFSTTCVWWWLNESPAVALVGSYMCLLTISSMIVTATRDPGILPRNLDPNPPYPATSPSDGGVRAPMPRDLKVRSDMYVIILETC